MIIRRSLTVLVLTLVFPVIACADFNQYLEEYLSKLENDRSAVFITKCFARGHREREASLIIDVTTKNGLLVEKNDNTVVNLADMKIDAEGLSLVETEGGIYSYKRATNLIKGMSKRDYRLYVPFVKSDFEKQTATQSCTNYEIE